MAIRKFKIYSRKELEKMNDKDFEKFYDRLTEYYEFVCELCDEQDSGFGYDLISQEEGIGYYGYD